MRLCVLLTPHSCNITYSHTHPHTHTYVVAAIRRWCRISVLGRSIAAYPSHCYHQPYGYRKLYIPLISNADFWKCTEQKAGYTDSNFSLHIQRIGSRRKVAMVSFSPEFIRTRQICECCASGIDNMTVILGHCADACQCIRIFRGSDHHLVVTLCT